YFDSRVDNVWTYAVTWDHCYGLFCHCLIAF
ncbi:MAG: hypothetical protein ACI9N3_002736, partial [Colwellia sp.]